MNKGENSPEHITILDVNMLTDTKSVKKKTIWHSEWTGKTYHLINNQYIDITHCWA